MIGYMISVSENLLDDKNLERMEKALETIKPPVVFRTYGVLYIPT